MDTEVITVQMCGQVGRVILNRLDQVPIMTIPSSRDGRDEHQCLAPGCRLGGNPAMHIHDPAMTRTLFDLGPEWVADTSDDWYTPAWIFTAAALEFDVDVCSPVDPERRTCPARQHLTVLEDGLTADWRGLVWMNPPYSKSAPWVARFAQHSSGLALLPATRSRSTAELLDCADAVTFFTGQFSRPDGRVDHNPWLLLLASRGSTATGGLQRIAALRGCKWWRGMHHIVSR